MGSATVLAGAGLPFDVSELGLTKPEQVALAGGSLPGAGRLGALTAGLFRAKVPMPAPHRPYELTVDAMLSFYRDLSAEAARFASRLAMWERLDQTARALCCMGTRSEPS